MMFNKNKLLCIKTESICFSDEFFQNFLFDVRSSRQKPKVVSIRPSDKRILIADLIQIKHYIGGVERAKKRNFEISNVRRCCGVSSPLCCAPLAFFDIT